MHCCGACLLALSPHGLHAHAAPGKHAPEILREVRATFAPRSMHALLGQSGSGKTTLLNILSGKGNGVFRGTLLLNGRAIKHAQLKHHANLVPQEDIMYDLLTVRETLTFYTKLRLPAEPAAMTRKRVDALMARLGLTGCADVHIGNALRPGISGGQRKRLSIGMEVRYAGELNCGCCAAVLTRRASRSLSTTRASSSWTSQHLARVAARRVVSSVV